MPSATPTLSPTPIDKDSDDYNAGYNDGSGDYDRDPAYVDNANYAAGYDAGKAAPPRKLTKDDRAFLRYLEGVGVDTKGRKRDLVDAGNYTVCLADPSDYWSLETMNADLIKQLRSDGFTSKEAHAIMGAARTELCR